MAAGSPLKSGTCCDLQSEKAKPQGQKVQYAGAKGVRLWRAERDFWEKPQLGSAGGMRLGTSARTPWTVHWGKGCAFIAGKPYLAEP